MAPSNQVEPTDDWKSALTASPANTDLHTLKMLLSELVNAEKRVTIIDNTSSDGVTVLYPLWLEKGIHVVTPNKTAFSGDIGLYNNIVNYLVHDT
jgi:homoserine dehydrogenase